MVEEVSGERSRVGMKTVAQETGGRVMQTRKGDVSFISMIKRMWLLLLIMVMITGDQQPGVTSAEGHDGWTARGREVGRQGRLVGADRAVAGRGDGGGVHARMNGGLLTAHHLFYHLRHFRTAVVVGVIRVMLGPSPLGPLLQHLPRLQRLCMCV